MKASRLPTRDRGIALITAMLVMALAAIAAAAVLGSATAAIRRSSTLIDSERAWWYADGAESWVLSILARDLKNSKIDALDEDWAQDIPPLPVEGGGLTGKLYDLEGRFNLNNLGSSNWQIYQKQFQRLFASIDGLDPSLATPIAESIHDWIDDNSTPTGSGAEDDEYMSRDPPYRAANQQMRSPTELLAIKGVTAEIYRALSPYVTALPLDPRTLKATPINANTADRRVLMALDDKINETELDTFMSNQKKSPAQSYAELQKFLPASVTPDMVGVTTEFFLLYAQAFIGTGRVSFYSVIRRPSSGTPTVISRSLDTE